jgi:hypothetical protein
MNSASWKSIFTEGADMSEEGCEEVGVLDSEMGVDDGGEEPQEAFESEVDPSIMVYGAPHSSPAKRPKAPVEPDEQFERLQARVERLETEHMSVNERDEKNLCELLQGYGFTKRQVEGMLLVLRASPLGVQSYSLDNALRPHDIGRVRARVQRPACVFDGDDSYTDAAGIAYGAPFGSLHATPSRRRVVGPPQGLPDKLEQIFHEIGPYFAAVLPHVIKAVIDRLDASSRPPLSWWQRKAHRLLGL